MKNVGTLLGICILVLALGVQVSAVSFEADASYLLGKGESGGSKLTTQGIALQTSVEFFPQLLVDGSFLSSTLRSTVKQGEEDEELPVSINLKHQLISGGALYQVLSDPDLQVVVGGGILELASKASGAEDVKGRGFYGKIGIAFAPQKKLVLRADLSYAPKYKVLEASGTFLNARATLSYEVYSDLGIQATIRHYKSSVENLNTSNTLVGGGITFSF